MALSMYLETLDGLEEGIKTMYVEHDGKFKLDVDGVEDPSALKSALDKERKARREAEAKAKATQALTPEELQEYEELRAQAAKAVGADKILEQMKLRHANELEDKANEATALRRNLEQTVIEAVATQTLAKHSADVDLLMPHILGQLKAEEIDGKIDVVPVSAASIDYIVTELREKYPAAFADLRGSGGGSRSSSGGPGGTDYKKLSPVERLNAARLAGGK